MIIKEITSKTEFDAGLAKIPHHDRHFLQSYEYGQLHLQIGNTPLFVGLYDAEGEILASLLFILFKARRGTYLFCPYGVHNFAQLHAVLPWLKQKAKAWRVDFLRFSPLLDDTEDSKKMFKKFAFLDAPAHMMHPELDLSLDLRKDAKTLLKEMRKNNRYGISKAKKDGVVVQSGNTAALLDVFYDLHAETATRQKFVPWSKKFLQAQLQVFAAAEQIKIYIGYYEGKAIAGAVIMFYEGRAYYHHGASLSEYNKIPASYLIQWKAMMDAKEMGCETYDFYGIVEDNPRHPWAGLSFFKKGFGGETRKILHCQDLPLTAKYWLNWLVETVRRIKRGY